MRLVDRRSSARNLPPAPAMPKFAEAQLTPQNNNLMTRNAMGQSMAPAGPRPTAPIINLPQMMVPQTKALPIGEVVLGGGFGQGVVPNSPRPAPTQINMPNINLPTDVTTGDYQLSSYDLTWDGLTPENQYLRPSHNLEIYGSGRDVDISHLNRVRPETMMSSVSITVSMKCSVDHLNLRSTATASVLLTHVYCRPHQRSTPRLYVQKPSASRS